MLVREIFNQVEELTGTYPTSENLRNAVHAIILGDRLPKIKAFYTINFNTEYIARSYEAERGISIRIGGAR